MKYLYVPMLRYYGLGIGGPALSVHNLLNSLDSYFDKIEVQTTSDLKINRPFKYRVRLINKGITYNGLVSKTTENYLLLNSLWYSWTHLVFGSYRFKKILLFPRGELLPGAIEQGPKLIKIILLWLIRLRSKNRLVWIATSEEELKAIKLFGFNCSTIVPNNVIDNHLVSERTKREGAMFLGRIARIKRLDILVQIWPKNRVLKIYGPVIDDEVLRNIHRTLETKDKIFLEAGVVHGDSKSRVFSSAKVFILPSKSENFGNVVLESLLHGTPVVTTAGPWEELGTKGCGMKVETIEQLIRESLEIIDLDEKQWSEMSQRCRDYAMEIIKDVDDKTKNLANELFNCN